MAEDHCHAARQASYEVREILDPDGGVDMETLFRCGEYAQAVDFALDYLGRRDPRRTGAVGGLQVLKDHGARRETVWTYDAAAQDTRIDPKHVWGYDVTRRWTGPTTPPLPRPATLRSHVPRRV